MRGINMLHKYEGWWRLRVKHQNSSAILDLSRRRQQCNRREADCGETAQKKKRDAFFPCVSVSVRKTTVLHRRVCGWTAELRLRQWAESELFSSLIFSSSYLDQLLLRGWWTQSLLPPIIQPLIFAIYARVSDKGPCLNTFSILVTE